MNNKENKPVINACLNFKHDSYNTSPCVIEKVIELPTSEFEELKDSTLDDNIFIKMHKDLMCFKDNAYHCLMFVDNKNGDGILVESEGADYARYSQYIPNAREILNQANQSEAMKALLKNIDNCIDEFIEQSGDKSDLCFSVNDLLCNPSVSDAIVIMCREALAKRPEIKSDTILDTNGFVEADKKELTELRLICPLEVDILEYEDSDYDPVTISSRQASAYEDEINEEVLKLEREIEHLNEKLRQLEGKNAVLDQQNKSISLELYSAKAQNGVVSTSSANFSNMELFNRISSLEKMVKKLLEKQGE